MTQEIGAWIQDFLRGEGNNVALADGLLLEKRHYFGPVPWKLRDLTRCCGPEPDMPYRTRESDFEKRVSGIIRRCETGWDMPPLIVRYEGGALTVSDGNHRHEAFRRMGKEEIPVIFWMTQRGDFPAFLAARRPKGA